MCSDKKRVLENTQNSFSKRCHVIFTLKITEKYFWRNSFLQHFYNKVATTFLKDEFFTGVTQGFLLQASDNLFCGVALSGCFLLKSSFVKLAASEITTKRSSKGACSEIFIQNPQKIHVSKFIFSMARSLQLL